MITRRDFLKVTGVAAAAAALTACGGSSSTASSAAASGSVASSAAAKLDKIKVAVPNDTTNEARALLLLEQEGLHTVRSLRQMGVGREEALALIGRLWEEKEADE